MTSFGYRLRDLAGRAVSAFSALRYAHPVTVWVTTGVLVAGLVGGWLVLVVTGTSTPSRPAPVDPPAVAEATPHIDPASVPEPPANDLKLRQRQCDQASSQLLAIAAAHPKYRALSRATANRVERLETRVGAACDVASARRTSDRLRDWLTGHPKK